MEREYMEDVQGLEFGEAGECRWEWLVERIQRQGPAWQAGDVPGLTLRHATRISRLQAGASLVMHVMPVGSISPYQQKMPLIEWSAYEHCSAP